ncbi:EAL domain-containing protein [Persephonella sp.]|uniref:EAL domain-containing protein n=1 Tax=Persephonella sp. TaxID=2060922 RepID=UPI00260E7DC8|nr:EAL domain-containing protein [Persephonella sp.]
MKRKDSISRLVLLWIILLAGIAFIFFTGFNIYQEIQEYNLGKDQLKSTIIEERKNLIKNQVYQIITLADFENSLLETKLKNNLKDVVGIADTLLGQIYLFLKGKIPDKEIQKMFLESVRKARFFGGRGYYFVTRADTTGIVLANPAFPEIENKSMWNYQDIYGKYVQREFLLAALRGGGFVSYYWYLPGHGKKPYKKIAYLKLFKPFNWIIGSGDYIEYLRQQIKLEFAQTIQKMEKNSSNRIILIDGFTQSCLLDTATCKEFSFIKNLKEGLSQYGNHLVYKKYYPEWDLYIASVFYLGDIKKVIEQRLSNLKENMKKDILSTTAAGGFLFTLLTIMSFIFFKQISSAEKELSSKEKSLQHERKNLVLKIYKDELTGLFNREKFNKDLEKHPVATIAVINIDKFREINDVFGYEFGDYILKTLAKILKKEAKKIHPKLKVYRIFGDEFVIADLDNNLSPEKFEKAIKNLVLKINNMIFRYGNEAVNLRVSAGISIAQNDPLQKADIALKNARILENEPVSSYIEESSAIAEYRENLIWVNKIKSALQDGRIVNYYQPVINNKTGQIEKYEVLVRLIDEDGTVYTPYHFLEIAKRYKLYTDISKTVIQNAFKTARKYGINLSINLSLSDIINVEMENFILQLLDTKDICEYITFELLEDESIEGAQEVIDFVNKVKNKGAKISIDDFGSGYSNFVYLVKLNIDYIKIDGSLIKTMLENKISHAIVEAIVTFAKEVNIKTIAEFVENEEIQKEVEKLGIDYSQGYYFGKPSPTLPIS